MKEVKNAGIDSTGRADKALTRIRHKATPCDSKRVNTTATGTNYYANTPQWICDRGVQQQQQHEIYNSVNIT